MATTYYGIIVKGDDKLLKGFVRGFEVGSSRTGGLWICDDHPIDKKISRAVRHFRGDYTRVICTAKARRGLLAAIGKAADLQFELVWEGKVTRSYFKFEFETFNRDEASKIKKLLASAPTGVRLVGYEPRETVDEEARGVELYAPVHDYKFRGKGTAEGAIEKLLAFRKALAADEFFELENITVEH
jgi:hypothetical protein